MKADRPAILYFLREEQQPMKGLAGFARDSAIVDQEFCR
jgi:hypothetical protein